MKLKNKLRSMQEETYTEGRFQHAACAAGTAPQGTVVTGTGAQPGGRGGLRLGMRERGSAPAS